jgi:hypothetical protein
VTILREADQRAVPEVAKKHGVSAQTIYAWRKHFGTLEPADVNRLRQLEHENGACALLSVARSALHYQSRLATQDAPVVAAMRGCTAPRGICGRTAAQRSSPPRCSPGSRPAPSTPRSLRPASRGSMAPTNRSTASSVTNV